MKSLLLGALGAIALPFTAFAEPAYYIFQLQIDDREAYLSQYIPSVMPTLFAYNAKVLVAAADPQVVEGEWAGNQTVVIEFESREIAEAWYNSSEYAAVRPLRLNAASVNNAVLVDTFALPK